MTESSNAVFDFEASTRRMQRMMIVLTVAGVVGFVIEKGWGWGLSFLAGALLAFASFRYTVHFVNGIGPAVEAKPSPLKMFVVATRYLLVVAILLLLKTSASLNMLSALLGLLIGAAAAMGEMVYQIATGAHRKH